jgi:GH25 family lysozyme M1 (1,4-beta-N-acetylmuramidase)
VSVRPPVARLRLLRDRRGAASARMLIAALVATMAVPALSAATVSAASRSSSPSAAIRTDATTAYLEGVDVSHWQGTISWSRVAAAGKAFAFIKASEARDYVDPLYASNRTAAQAAGLWTGAYHFARPDATAGDALAEADHFVATLHLGHGDLIPALDLEQTGGLSVAALQSWVTTWLGEVTKKLGIRPMIYTSPYFWQHSMADTRALADAGYKTLWVAHWGATTPTVPASNWGGHGWTFWQYSDCGAVSGISGCVDLDRYRGTDLVPQAYSIFSLTAAPAGQVKQGQTAAAATVGISRTNFPSEVALQVDGLPAGASAAFDASPTTLTSSALTVSTDAAVTPTGTYPLTIVGTGAGLTRSATVSLVVADGVPPTIVAPSMWLEPNSIVGSTSMPIYSVWSASDPSGVASYGLERSVTGGSTWSTVKLATSLSRSVWQWVPFGSSVVQRSRATDRLANTSAWTAGHRVSALLTQEYASSIRYSGTWATSTSSYSLGGSQRYATSAGATATYTFSGSSVGWVATRGPNRGSAKVYIDGVYAGTVNLHASSFAWRRVVFAKNWGTVGQHTLRIVAADARHPIVDVDAFIRLWQS